MPAPRQSCLPAVKQEQTAAEEGMTHDKAKWHLEGEFPRELDEQQAYVPGGMLVAWVTARGLLSEMATEDFGDELARLRARSITGAEAYGLLGGVLESDLLDGEADALLPSEYHVPDNWASYDRIAPSIDASFARWQAGKPPGA
jgi:hypothetical protein